ncbi:MAG TPA: hypothetical protein VN643_26510 [Pyrinomonadaceae bacterium]|nr:hypothetical protein [Pyrinomonadaceae bacterium]
MNKRPVTILIVGWLFILAGSVGLIYHSLDVIRDAANGLDRHELIDAAVILPLRVIAIISGVFILYACNWARWLCVLWMAFHVVVSIWHSAFAFVFHLVLTIVIGLLLFRPKASEYFRKAQSL